MIFVLVQAFDRIIKGIIPEYLSHRDVYPFQLAASVARLNIIIAYILALEHKMRISIIRGIQHQHANHARLHPFITVRG